MSVESRSVPNSALSSVFEQLVFRAGSASHPWCQPAIDRNPTAFVRNSADFADAVHHLGLLHGQIPGVIDFAARHVVDNAARLWLLDAVDAFAVERAFLGRLVVAVGPLPSTAGQQNVTTLINQQRHALDMLAQSDRRGCALGAAMALVLDWQAIRAILEAGAVRTSVMVPACRLPDTATTLAALDATEAQHPVSRAAQFGATQLLGQHRTIWDLLQARADLRRAALP